MENMGHLQSKIPFTSRQPTPIEQQDLTEYIKTIKRYAHNITSKHHEIAHYYDEILSFGMFSLFKHLRVYDSNRGEFKPFLVNIYYNMRKFAVKLKKKYTLTDSLENSPFIEDTMDINYIDNKIMIRQILLLLTPAEQKIMIDRFFYDKTLEEIGHDFGLSKERIRQKVNTILDKIRRKIAHENFRNSLTK